MGLRRTSDRNAQSRLNAEIYASIQRLAEADEINLRVMQQDLANIIGHGYVTNYAGRSMLGSGKPIGIWLKEVDDSVDYINFVLAGHVNGDDLNLFSDMTVTGTATITNLIVTETCTVGGYAVATQNWVNSQGFIRGGS